MRLTTKYPLTIVAVALIAALVTGFVAYQKSKTELQLAAERQSVEILASRKAALGRYLNSIRQDLSLLAANNFTRDALYSFSRAWQRMLGNPQERLQKLYIHDNPHPTGEKDKLDRADDGSAYSDAHGRYHPWFRRFLEERGYYDIFLFDTEGNLVYTVFKELDYATNVTHGRWRETDLGRAFRTSAFNQFPEFQAFFDFKPYEPSHGAPASFIATPVFDVSGNFIGVLAFQMPIGRINDIMQVSAGMGKSGRAYLVGQDLLVRNDTRFSTATEILKTKKSAKIVSLALEGQSGAQVISDNAGMDVLATYTSINFAGQSWAIITEIELAEILSPVDEMRRFMIVAGLVIGAVVTIVGFWFASGLSRPIVAVTEVMQRLAHRDLDFDVPALGRKDEIGDMADALVVFKENAVERKRAEEEVIRNRRILQALADNLPEFISLKDSDFRFVFVNRCFEEWVGIKREDIIGKTVHEVYDPERAAEFDALDRQAIAEGIATPREVELSYPDGNTRYVVSTRFPVVSESGEGLGLGTINFDISERKLAEEELRIARNTAEEATRAKSSFLATMSHEIRTPMNGLMSMAELLNHTDLSEEQRSMSAIIRESGAALLVIINDILDFSKIEAGKMDLESVELSVVELVEAVAQLLAPQAAEKGLSLTAWVDPTLADCCVGDPTRLRQILLNLAGNAVKFTDAGSVAIEVAAGEKDGKAEGLEFRITGTGVGMTEEQQKRLFQPFQQADSSTARKFGGTGLGLTICLRLVEMMGGEIGLESEAGVGSTFWFKVPLPLIDGPAESDQIVDFSGARILMLGDDTATLETAGRYLAFRGAEIVDAASIDENEGPVPVVLIDDGNRDGPPQMDAAAVGDAQIIRLLPYGTPPAGHGAAAANTFATLSKPITRDRLWRTVGAALGLVGMDDPVADEERRYGGIIVPKIDEAEAAGALILVAEDNKTNQIVIRKLLDKLGFAAEIADDGAMAFEMLTNRNFGLLLTDCHMPNMDGYELTKKIRVWETAEDRARLPVIALTADALADTERVCLDAGMDGYLSKPVEMAKLESAILDKLPAAHDLRQRGGAVGAADEEPEPVAETQIDPNPETDDDGLAVLDTEMLLFAFDEINDEAKEMLAEFVRTSRQRIGELHKALREDDLDTACMAAHTMKGSSNTIGAYAFGQLATDIEDHLNNENAKAAKALSGELEPAFEKLERAIAAL